MSSWHDEQIHRQFSGVSSPPCDLNVLWWICVPVLRSQSSQGSLSISNRKRRSAGMSTVRLGGFESIETGFAFHEPDTLGGAEVADLDEFEAPVAAAAGAGLDADANPGDGF